jgi:PAS domain S-box-containing protein
MPIQTAIESTNGRTNGRKQLQQITSKVSDAIGMEFLEALVSNLAEPLHADYVFLGEFAGGQEERLKTVASFGEGPGDPQASYALAGTLAAQVATGEPCSINRGLQKRFPSDELVRYVRAQAGIAVPLLDCKRRAIGVLMALYRDPISSTQTRLTILQTFAARAAAEVCRRQADAASREAEQRYRLFIAKNQDAMWRIEFESPIPIDLPEEEQVERIYRFGYLAECNDAMARLYGQESAVQLVGAHFEELARYADPRLRDHVRSAIRSSYRFDVIEVDSAGPDGKSRSMLRTQWGIVDDGMLQRVWGTNRDITELRKSMEKRLPQLLDNLEIMAVTLDESGRIQFGNDYLLQLTGWQRAELAGKNWFDLMIPTGEQERWRSAYLAKGPQIFEGTLFGKDGRHWTIAWETTVLRDAEGRAGLGCIGRRVHN